MKCLFSTECSANKGAVLLTLVVILFSTFKSQVIAEEQKVVCPSLCKCDTFKELLRATCTDRKLLSVEANVPKQAEMLDLSYNSIAKLPANIFLEIELTSLRWLNLSHNNIREVHLGAFRGLLSLVVLDMSHNHLQYLLEDWFWESTNLKELIFHHNAFGTFKSVPIINSASLQILDLSNSEILFIPPEAFTKLGNLTTLDLRGNYLSEMTSKMLSPMQRLRKLYMKNNSIKCNTARYDIMRQYCVENDIKLDQKCTSKQGKAAKEEKSQKMVVAPDLATTPEEEETFWIIADSGSKVDPDNCTCEANVTLPACKTDNLLSDIFHLSPPLMIAFVLCVGFLLGLIMGCTVQFSRKVTKNEEIPRRRRSIIRPMQYNQKWDDIEILLHRANFQDPSTTSPVMSTRRPRIASSYY